MTARRTAAKLLRFHEEEVALITEAAQGRAAGVHRRRPSHLWGIRRRERQPAPTSDADVGTTYGTTAF